MDIDAAPAFLFETLYRMPCADPLVSAAAFALHGRRPMHSVLRPKQGDAERLEGERANRPAVFLLTSNRAMRQIGDKKFVLDLAPNRVRLLHMERRGRGRQSDETNPERAGHAPILPRR